MNAINVIQPYRHLGIWVFDDARVGLKEEAFVAGADLMIDRITAELPDPHNGFVMIFSRHAFPSARHKLEWRRVEDDGNVYYSRELDLEGWLCPALLLYFKEPPREIYVEVRAREGANRA